MGKVKQLNIVGVGASAGGLAVLKTFVSTLPKQGNVAYLIVQHLDPTHDSMLSELLQKVSTLPVHVAENEARIEPENVYVIPPNVYLEVADGKLKLTPPQEVRGMRKAVDHLFRSLANECGRRCTGIVLSGAGNDGTAGLRMIKAAGGLTIAQNPKSAEHSSMPESAIKAGVIDKVLEVRDIWKVLHEYIKHPYLIEKEEETSLGLDDGLHEIANILGTQEDFDITQYKPGTIQRRIARRMGLSGMKNYSEYLEIVRHNDQERRQLIKDLLISVTDFFRDPDAFTMLENKVLPELVMALDKEEDLRVWVAGCATGEEVYSLTIFLMEALDTYHKTNRIRVFATDIDEEAIGVARKGVYSDSVVAEVPKNYLGKYFIKLQNEHFQIQRQVRDLVSFAVQNVANDPPFSQMHLISCRNVLIYFKKQVQQDVLNSFHFALKPKGHLFLGSAESLGVSQDKFKVISKKWRLYKKESVTSEPIMFQRRLNARGRSRPPENKKRDRPVAITRAEQLRRDLLTTLLPPTMIISSKGDILYNHGNLSPYVIVPEGEPHNDLFRTLTPALNSRVRSALFKVRKTGEAVSFTYLPSAKHSNRNIIEVEAKLLRDGYSAVEDAICITFLERPLIDPNDEQPQELDQDKAVQQIEQELVETKEELQNTIEELETSTEELKASHEEALSTNEELQSANEELEASTEELRSLNEELRTVNEQLKEKIGQMQSMNDDLSNFFSSTNIPTLFLDPSLKIQRYTPAAEVLLGLGQMDIDRPVHALNNVLISDDLVNAAKQVLLTFETSHSEKKNKDDRWFDRMISPYRTEDRRINGVVVTFQDITEMKTLSEAANRRERQQATVAQLGLLALSGMEIPELMDTLVREVAHTLDTEYCKVLKYRPEHNDLLMVSGYGWRAGLVGQATVPDQHDSQAGYTLIRKEAIIVPDLKTEKRFSGPDLLIEHKVVSGMSVAINHADSPYGVLGIHTRSFVEFNQDDANFIQVIANLLSVAIKDDKASKALIESESRLRIAKESGNIGAFEIRLDLEDTKWDKTLKRIWGINEEDDLTQDDFWAGVHPDDRQHTQAELDRAMLEDGMFSVGYRVINKVTGNIAWVRAYGQVFYEDKKPIKMIGMVQDVTEMSQSEISLKLANEELQEVNVRKNEFIATLGHELRNPLAAISGSVELIQADPAYAAQFTDMMSRNVKRMACMLDDLLDIARIAKGTVKIDRKEIDLKRILNQVFEEYEPILLTKNQSYTLDYPDENIMISGDENRLEQIFGNLMTNAHKFTQEGGEVVISVELKGSKVEICVSDNGIGLEGDLNRVFEPFIQVSSAKGSKGLGIGLALVRDFVRLHDGEITVESEGHGKGCTFKITFDALIEKSKTKSMTTAANKNNDVVEIKKGLRLMIADDNEDAATLLKMRLDKAGCNVTVAYNAKEALKKLNQAEPEVFILDIGLPDVDGYTLLNEIKKKHKRKATYIAHTGFGHMEATEESRKAGFDYHLTKPIDLNRLMKILSFVK